MIILLQMKSKKFVEALVPSACGFSMGPWHKRPYKLSHFGWINFLLLPYE
jgi:hypothetical protein